MEKEKATQETNTKIIIVMGMIFAVVILLFNVATAGNQPGQAVFSAQEIADSGVEKIDLNTATQAELMVLPGIDVGLSEKILLYRESSGGFEDLEELKNVYGIGEIRYQQISPYLRVK